MYTKIQYIFTVKCLVLTGRKYNLCKSTDPPNEATMYSTVRICMLSLMRRSSILKPWIH